MSRNSSTFLGQEVIYNSEDNSLVHFNSEARSHGGGGSGSGGSGGGTKPPPPLVTTAGSLLEFNRIWVSWFSNRVTNEPGFVAAVTNVAHYYESLFTTPKTEVINIKVGWGEVA